VAPRTVSKWFDSGQLRGYRIPGSKDRRIPIQQLVRFMKAHGMPLNGLETGQIRVLVLEPEPELRQMLGAALREDGGYEVRAASGPFEAGVTAGAFQPHVMLIDVDLGIEARELCRQVRANPDLQATRLVAGTSALDDGQQQGLLQQGFDACLPKPFQIRDVINTIEELTAIVY